MRILHVSAQRPGNTGSGIFLQAMVRQAALAGYTQFAVVGGAESDDLNELAPLSCNQWRQVLFPSASCPFPVPGMSDIMPYPSTRYRDLSSDQVQAWRAAFREALEAAVAEFQPDLIHCHHLWLVTALVRECFPQIPVMASAHGTGLRQALNVPHLAEQVRPMIQKLDQICALTEASKQQIMQVYGVDPQKITVTGSGFRDELFKPAERSREQLYQDLAEAGLSLPEGNRFICYVGRLSTPKGLPWLIEAFSQAKIPEDVSLLLVGGTGSGADGPQVAKLASDTPRVIAPGPFPQDVIAQILQLAEYFVLPSLYEGLPLVLLEALACGTPVIVSDLPTVVNWLPQAWVDKGAVRLVKRLATQHVDQAIPEDEARFTADLKKTLEEAVSLAQPKDLTMAAEAKAFGWGRVFQRYQKIYQQLT